MGAGVGAGAEVRVGSAPFSVTTSSRSRSAAPEASGFAFVTGSARERVESVRRIAAAAPPAAAAAALGRLAFEEADPQVRSASIAMLAELPGSAGDEELARVARAHPTFAARRDAVDVLGGMGCDLAVRTLVEVAELDADERLQRLAVEALARAHSRALRGGGADPAEVREVIRRLSREHESTRVRQEAADALSRLSQG